MATPTNEQELVDFALRRDAERAVMVVNIELPLEAGELIEKALDKARDDTCLEHPDIIDTTWAKRQADHRCRSNP